VEETAVIIRRYNLKDEEFFRQMVFAEGIGTCSPRHLGTADSVGFVRPTSYRSNTGSGLK
jgi:hypothetical protein